MIVERLSPEWWRDRLLTQYESDYYARRQILDVYEGIHPLPRSMPRYQAQYEKLLKSARTPWGRMIVDTTAERLHFQGFRVEGNAEPDTLVWEWFKKASMDQLQRNVYREAMATEVSYVSVWPSNEGAPRIMPESSLQVTHELEGGSVDEVAAAIKVWPDEVNLRWHCVLYLPEATYHWTAGLVEGTDIPRAPYWEPLEWHANPIGKVPIVPFVCRQDMTGRGRSELSDLLPLFDRFEMVTADMLVASSFGAFRQRWATGLEIPIDPTTGNEVEPYKLAVDRLWISESEDTKFGAFDATDLTPYVRLKDAIVAEIAAISRVPSSYFVQSELANPPSAQALEASEVNLISKVRERQMAFGDAWEKVVQYALRATSDPRADLSRVETLWKDPRTRSESQVLDAASKMVAIGFPFEAIAEFIGYGPDDVARLSRMRVRQQLMDSLQGAGGPGQQQPGQNPPPQQQQSDAGTN